MAKLVIVSLGTLSGALLESAARRARFDEIVVASSDFEKAKAKANNARIGAALEGKYPSITPALFDMYAPDAAARLRDFGADVLFAAPSMMPWWRLRELGQGQRAWLTAAPFATFMACHLAPMLHLRDVVTAAGITVPWIGASSPDVVNAVLHRTGAAPVCGTGNVAEVVPKIALALGHKLNACPSAFDIELVAQHAFEYHCFGTGSNQPPPYMLRVLRGHEDLTELAHAELFTPYPFPYQLDFNLVTVSATNTVLEALMQDRPVPTHVPAPSGRVGGYPVLVSRHGVALNLPSHWTEQQAISINQGSLSFDGIEDIGPDGTVRFTPQCAAAIEQLIGAKTLYLRPDNAHSLAHALVAALA